MSSGLNDSEIVRGLRNGDRVAWNALCSQYGGQLWRYVFRLVGPDKNSVADVFQETLLAVSKSGRSIREETKLWAWLSRIGHNQAALHWRKRSRDRGVLLDDEAADLAVGNQPVDSILRSETVDSVRLLLSEMNSEHVALLVSKYLDEMSISQIVDAIGGTQESVRSKLARARREFREQYERLNKEQLAASVLRQGSPDKGAS